MSPGRRRRACADLDQDLVRIDVEVICLELFFKFDMSRALQWPQARQVILVVIDVVEVLLKQFAMQHQIFKGRLGQPCRQCFLNRQGLGYVRCGA
ncbi:hypothetical protein D3C85_1482080 [compost metagenome]